MQQRNSLHSKQEEFEKALDDAIQAALTGAKSPEAALKEAQSTADRLLRSYR